MRSGKSSTRPPRPMNPMAASIACGHRPQNEIADGSTPSTSRHDSAANMHDACAARIVGNASAGVTVRSANATNAWWAAVTPSTQSSWVAGLIGGGLSRIFAIIKRPFLLRAVTPPAIMPADNDQRQIGFVKSDPRWFRKPPGIFLSNQLVVLSATKLAAVLHSTGLVCSRCHRKIDSIAAAFATAIAASPMPGLSPVGCAFLFSISPPLEHEIRLIRPGGFINPLGWCFPWFACRRRLNTAQNKCTM